MSQKQWKQTAVTPIHTAPRKRRGMNRNVATLLVLVLTLFLFFLYRLLPMGLVLISEQKAYALAPPVYPGSLLVDSRGEYASWWSTDYLTYRTADNITQVYPFMEKEMPGFTMEVTDAGVIRYVNEVRHDNWLWRHAEWMSERPESMSNRLSVRPRVHVTLQPDPENPTGTSIHVRVMWISS